MSNIIYTYMNDKTINFQYLDGNDEVCITLTEEDIDISRVMLIPFDEFARISKLLTDEVDAIDIKEDR